MNKPLYEYVITFLEDSDYEDEFCCLAEDIPHAVEQAEDAYPGILIVKIIRGQIAPNVDQDVDEILSSDYKYIIYSGLTDKLLTTDVFDSYEEAVKYIGSLNDQVIIRIRV